MKQLLLDLEDRLGFPCVGACRFAPSSYLPRYLPTYYRALNWCLDAQVINGSHVLCR